jgi:hypothetical protein
MPTSRLRSVGLSVLVVAVVLLGVVGPRTGAASGLQLRQRELNHSGAWSWFGDPRAVYHQGAHRRTYVGWVSTAGDIQVASYDHDSGVRVVATVKASFQVDDHASPSLLVRPDGHLLVFWSAHSGSAMFYRRSAQAEDVSSWEAERQLPTNTPGPWGYTYPNPVQLSGEGNRIWLFWRGGNFNPTFSTSDDGAATWAPARTLISVPDQRPYVKAASNGTDTIHFAFAQGHPRNLQTNIYYARYRAGSFYRANGALIKPVSGLPFTPAQADKVYDAAKHGGVKAWIHDVAFDQAGRPIVVFATFPSISDHRYHYARWTGSGWVDHEFATAGGSMSGDPVEPNYSGGVTLDHANPARVFLSRQVSGHFEIQVYRTTDGGHTWVKRVVTSASGRGNYRPVNPRGEPEVDLDIVWMRGGYPSYSAYRTAIDVEALSRDVFSPAVAALGTGQLQVLASDGTGALIRKDYAGGWTGWEDTGRGPSVHHLGAPTTASSAPGRLDVFAVDQTTAHLLQRSNQGGVWSGWEDRGAGPGGHAVASPAAASWGPGRLDVVARDTVTGDLIHWSFDGSWHGPVRAVAPAGGAYVPAMAAWGASRLDVFTIDSRHLLAHAYFNGRWNGWESLGAGPGGVAYHAPAAVASWAPRRLDVFAATGDGRALAHRWFDGAGTSGWQGPQTLSAGTGPDRLQLAGMAAASWADGRLDVFSTDAHSHGLLHTWYAGSWQGPEHLDFSGPAAAVSADASPRAAPIPLDERIRSLGDD